MTSRFMPQNALVWGKSQKIILLQKVTHAFMSKLISIVKVSRKCFNLSLVYIILRNHYMRWLKWQFKKNQVEKKSHLEFWDCQDPSFIWKIIESVTFWINFTSISLNIVTIKDEEITELLVLTRKSAGTRVVTLQGE